MMRMMIAAAALAALAFASAARAEDFVLDLVEVVETKALYGTVESRFVVPARGRIGGTLVTLEVTEGTSVEAGDVIARIVDSKLESQLAAAEARIAAARSQLGNAETELRRADELLSRGATTQQRVDQIRTAVDVAANAVAEAEAARAVIVQQIGEGDVVAPAAGMVLTVPVRLGEVVMPGEPVATIAGGGVFLRLSIPERHAEGLTAGAAVDAGDTIGTIEKVYPRIEGGRVTADVAVEGLSGRFVGQRILVRVPVTSRTAIAVPDKAIRRVGGLDLVSIRTPEGEAEVTVVPGGALATAVGDMREVLTGLRPGDVVILP